MTRSFPPLRTSDFGVLFSSARWALRLAWSTNARLLIAVTAVALGRGSLPAATAVAARGIVNTSVAAVRSDVHSIAAVVPWLVLGFVLTTAEGISLFASRLFAQRLRDDFHHRVTAEILNHAAGLDMAHFEAPLSGCAGAGEARSRRAGRPFRDRRVDLRH